MRLPGRRLRGSYGGIRGGGMQTPGPGGPGRAASVPRGTGGTEAARLSGAGGNAVARPTPAVDAGAPGARDCPMDAVIPGCGALGYQGANRLN